VAIRKGLDARKRSSRQAPGRSRPLAFAAIAVALLAATLVRAVTESVPPIALHRTLAAELTLPGRAPALAWPSEGQAAVTVQGVGSLGVSGPRTPAPIASVAKVMTAYLTLQEHPLAPGRQGFLMTVTPAQAAEERSRAAQEQSVARVRAGERLSERQALEALMLPSADNVAAMLAAYDAGSVEAFVAQMNRQARALGMRSTTYTDPSGFKHTTVSTATDQLKLAQVAMRNPTFAAIVDMRAATLPVAGSVFNYNGLLGEDGYVGIKTGSDEAAGGCLLFAKRITVAGRRLTVLGVVLGQQGGELIEAGLLAAKRLGNSAAAAVRVKTAVPARAVVALASSAGHARIPVVSAHPLRVIGFAGQHVHVALSLDHAPRRLRAGQRAGVLSVAHSSVGPASTPVVAGETVGGPTLGWRLSHLF
jgi:D-alanyl-D-alanine carboxypeptidase (penicillin-binding protein 5/6)